MAQVESRRELSRRLNDLFAAIDAGHIESQLMQEMNELTGATTDIQNARSDGKIVLDDDVP